MMVTITGAGESADEEHNKHANPQPCGGRFDIYPHLRSLHCQRLCPHVLALWPLLVGHHFHPHLHIIQSLSYLMATFLGATLIETTGFHGICLTSSTACIPHIIMIDIII